VEQAGDALDDLLRNATVDPFIRHQGEITGVDISLHPSLHAFSRKWGRAMTDLYVEKRREIEKYCPSGHYPTPVLWEGGKEEAGGKEISLPEVLRRILQALRKEREGSREREGGREGRGGGVAGEEEGGVGGLQGKEKEEGEEKREVEKEKNREEEVVVLEGEKMEEEKKKKEEEDKEKMGQGRERGEYREVSGSPPL